MAEAAEGQGPAARRLTVVSTEAELLAVSAAWDAALVDNDADAVASFMADDGCS